MNMRYRETHADQTRNRILAVSLSLFAQRGFEGASTRAIADAAGVNVATLSYHFGGKQGLYDAVVSHVADELVQALPAAIAQAGEGTPAIGAVTRAIWAVSRRLPDHVRLVCRHTLDYPAVPDTVVDRVLSPMVAALVAGLRAERPSLSAARATALAMHGAQGIVHLAIAPAAWRSAVSGGELTDDAAVIEALAAQMEAAAC